MQGRGLPMVRFSGNMLFRSLCKTRQSEYTSKRRHAQKDDIARSIVQEIQRRGGRFLRRGGSKGGEETADGDGLVWIEGDDDVAIEKAKQAMRDNKLLELQNSKTARHDNDSPNMPLYANEVRSTALSSIREDAVPPQFQQQLDTHLRPCFPESGQSSSYSLPDHRQLNQTETAGSIPSLFLTGGSGAMPANNRSTNHADAASRRRSFSLPHSIPALSAFAWHGQLVPGQALYHPPSLVGGAAHRWDSCGPPTGGIGGVTHGPWSLQQWGHERPTNQHDDDPRMMTALPETYHQKLQALPPDQRDTFLLELPGAYQEMLPIILANARHHGQLYPLAPRDAQLLQQARSLALQRGDALRAGQVEFIFQTAQDIADLPSDLVPSILLQQQQQRPPLSVSCVRSASFPGNDDRKPVASTGVAVEPGGGHNHHPTRDFLGGSDHGGTNHKRRTTFNQRHESDSSLSSSTSRNLPLKKRARRNDD